MFKVHLATIPCNSIRLGSCTKEPADLNCCDPQSDSTFVIVDSTGQLIGNTDAYRHCRQNDQDHVAALIANDPTKKELFALERLAPTLASIAEPLQTILAMLQAGDIEAVTLSLGVYADIELRIAPI